MGNQRADCQCYSAGVQYEVTKRAEQQTMSDEQYEILAAKRKKILQAAAEKQLHAQKASQELEGSTRSSLLEQWVAYTTASRGRHSSESRPAYYAVPRADALSEVGHWS